MGNFGTDVLEEGIRRGRKEGAREETMRALRFMTVEREMSLRDAMDRIGLPLKDEAMHVELLEEKK